MIITVPDKIIAREIENTDYIMASDEAECCAIAGGAYLATGENSSVYISADGFCNCLNFLTSWIIPDGIGINFIISYGRQEPQHKVMSDILMDMVKLLPYDSKKISFRFITK